MPNLVRYPPPKQKPITRTQFDQRAAALRANNSASIDTIKTRDAASYASLQPAKDAAQVARDEAIQLSILQRRASERHLNSINQANEKFWSTMTRDSAGQQGAITLQQAAGKNEGDPNVSFSTPASPISPPTNSERPSLEELNQFYEQFWKLEGSERDAFVAAWQKVRAEKAKPKLDGRPVSGTRYG